MANPFLETIVLPVSAGRAALVVACLLGPLAVACFLLADLGAGGWRLAAPLAVLCAAALLATLASARPPCRASLLRDGAWRLAFGDGGVVPAVLESCWGARWGLCLGLEWRGEDGCRYRAWLLPGDVRGTTWRRLRVRLLIA